MKNGNTNDTHVTNTRSKKLSLLRFLNYEEGTMPPHGKFRNLNKIG